MKTRDWIAKNLHEIEGAQKRAIAILRHPELAHAHEMVVDTLADMVIAKAFLHSSATLLHKEGRWDEELKTKNG